MTPRPRGGYSDVYVEHPVKVLQVEPQSVVIVRGETWDEDNFAELRAALRPDVLVIHLPAGESLEVLDEEQMRAAGWVRANP